MKKPSAETQVRQLKSEVRRLKVDLAQANNALRSYRGRATKAETEAADWRKRFDMLLAREPEGKPEVQK